MLLFGFDHEQSFVSIDHRSDPQGQRTGSFGGTENLLLFEVRLLHEVLELNDILFRDRLDFVLSEIFDSLDEFGIEEILFGVAPEILDFFHGSRLFGRELDFGIFFEDVADTLHDNSSSGRWIVIRL